MDDIADFELLINRKTPTGRVLFTATEEAVRELAKIWDAGRDALALYEEAS